MANQIIRNVIVDTPTSKDMFRGKGHELTALSLAQTIRNFDEDDRAIGLDGPWGSGKSSVVEIAAKHLATTRGQQSVSHHFFTFDIWKSQGTGFRRSFLEHFVAWAQAEFPKKKPHLQKIEEEIRGKKREISTNNQPVLGWFGIVILFLLPLMPIYYFWTKVVFDRLSKIEGSSFFDYLTEAPAFVFYAFVAGVVVATWQKMSSEDNEIRDVKTALSSVLLISSKQHQDHKSIQRIREIDPNDYEFHATLRKILATVQTEKRKVVVVLDNIDRLPQEEIRDYWALVRSIFSGAHQSDEGSKNQTITAIVPYDRTLIERSLIDQSGINDVKTNEALDRSITRLCARELFSKTFDEILSIAPPVMSNAREFFAEKLEEALPKQISRDHSFRTYRIFTELLQVDGGLTTPRQVVSFVNDVSGLYALHNGQFKLPTIAAYLAHQDIVSRAPGTLNDQSKLDRKILDLASDPELAKNLAAIVFNVEPDLAFEVLLDPELTLAIVASSHEELERLSQSPGFDLRVDDVVQANSEQWRSTGDLGRAIVNFSKVLPGYDGEAKPRVLDALIKAFGEISSFAINDDTYQQYLSLLDVAEANDRPELLRGFLQKAFNGVRELEIADFDAGRDFANFLGESRKLH